ncbi:hypothetical protein SDC9_133454 [bioreactor metagenome]|uniref:Uncharacterized protein n=1 Tax=bioreactor metagenome TaxID=1076179 RepID=A0A645DAU8_9ZZZZ|nr:hypothetical protein [Lachnospiraceae bacterium]
MNVNKSCPKCGCEYVYIKESYKGQALFCFNLEAGEEGDNSGYYDGCVYKRKAKFVICAECGARVMTVEEFKQIYEKK